MATRLSFAQCLTLVMNEGQETSMLFRGTPGIGKSTLLESFCEAQPDYISAMIDCANLQAGEISLPVIDPKSREYSWALSEDFCFNSTRPVALYLDEFGKANQGVINNLLPILQDRRVGKRHLPAGSVVFGSTNLDTDQVGDRIPAQAYNRMAVMDMRGPTADEWITWAGLNGVASEIIAFVKVTPSVLQEYVDLPRNIGKAIINPYIFDPTAGRNKTFCSARSLAKMSKAVSLYKEGVYSAELFEARAAGGIGEAAASELTQLLRLGVSLPSADDVLTNPTAAKARVTDSPSAHYLMASAYAQYCVMRKDKKAVIDGLARFVESALIDEAHMLFYSLVSKSATSNGNSAFLMTCLSSPVVSAGIQRLTGIINGTL